jgi:hypothetical protein
MAASTDGHGRVLKLLLHAGADINKDGSVGQIEVIECGRGRDECKRHQRIEKGNYVPHHSPASLFSGLYWTGGRTRVVLGGFRISLALCFFLWQLRCSTHAP